MENYNQEMEQIRLLQEMEQNRINQEFVLDNLSNTKSRNDKKGLIVLIVFAVIVIGMFIGFSAAAQLPPELQLSPVQTVPCAKQDPPFADPEIGRCATKVGDRNGDGVLSRAEADSLEVLNLTSYRIHMFEVKTYEDLKRFPNLKKVWLGESDIQELDLSDNYKLEIICVQSDSLKVLTLAVGCHPQLITPNREGELIIRRKYNDKDPNSIWYR